MLKTQVFPTHLVTTSSKNTDNTMYRVKIITGKPLMQHQAINIAMINDQGSTILKRLPYLSTTEESSHVFQGPNIGTIASILVSPEDDSMFLKDVYITKENIKYQKNYYNYNENNKDNEIENYTFTYNDLIGRRGGNMAAHLNPYVKPSIDMKPIYDAEYAKLKSHIMFNVFEFAAVGTAITYYFTNIESAYAYAIGGGMGCLYISMLENGIDVIGKKGGVGHSTARLCAISVVAASILSKYKENIQTDHSLFIYGIVGFMMYMVALVNSYLYLSVEKKETKNIDEVVEDDIN